MEASQTHRELEFISPLGKDILLLRRFKAVEELGRLYRFELTLRSTDPEIDFESLLGQNVSIRLDIAGGRVRYFNGYITEFSQDEDQEVLSAYHATVSPWLWFLQRTQDCRIFQEQNAVDIIEAVFRDNGTTDYELRLFGDYRNREYTVQYRESDFNFVSRLMEEEGIYYFFEHEMGKHRLILADSYSAHEMIPAYTDLPYYPSKVRTAIAQERINYWKHHRTVRSGAVALNDYDFKKSRWNIRSSYTYPKEHARADAEIYDYPGNYLTEDQGHHYAQMRQEALHSAYAVIEGNSTARELTAGGLMKLDKHPRQDQNIEYLITSVTHDVDQDAFRSSGDGAGFNYQNSFTVLDSHTPFRSECTTQVPTVEGPQNAHVVGPKGEEIYCDEFGRVKVQFPWDRYGKHNQNSSCWIRVSQVHAGKRFGGIDIPRIGEAVIIEFFEGNPDRPIITGRVYNDNSMPPHELPANKTVSGIKTHSSKGGRGFNEFHFEDKKGQERILVHAEKDQDIRVKHDQFETIEHQSHRTVKSDDLVQIEGDNHSTVQGDKNERVHGTVSHTIDAHLQQKIGGKHGLEAGSEIHLQAGVNVVIEAGMSITLRAGGGSIVIGPTGVTLAGAPILSSIPIVVSGGVSPVPGSGCSPATAKLPLEAATGKPGEVERVRAAAPADAAREGKPISDRWVPAENIFYRHVAGRGTSAAGAIGRAMDEEVVSADFSEENFKKWTGGLSIERSQKLYHIQTGEEISRETIETLFTDPKKAKEILMNNPRIHKRYRDILNSKIPQDIKDVDSSEWIELSKAKSFFHGSFTRGHRKFVSKAGEYREVIFDENGDRVDHQIFKGSFNLFSPNEYPKSHILVDVDPYVKHGN